jgi:raffinose/stachyose/melibiose transport system permease protein
VSTVLERLSRHTILLLATAIVLIPFLGILSVALQPSSAAVTGLSIPHTITWANFARAWNLGHFEVLLRSSAIIALVVVPLSVAGSVLSGYAFATMQFVGRGLLYGLMMIGVVMPFEATVVSLFYMFSPMGLIDTYWSVILPEIGLSVAFGTFWLRSAFGAVPIEIIEAARLDGAGPLQLLRHVFLPVTRASILTLGTLFFLWSWNEFLLALVFLQSTDHMTAPAGLAAFLGQYTSDIPGLCASALIVMLPVIVVYVATQRTFVRGMLDGAVK